MNETLILEVIFVSLTENNSCNKTPKKLGNILGKSLTIIVATSHIHLLK